jgi:hypothetical protein
MTAMGSFADEAREAIAAANEYVAREIERAVAAGHAVHFIDDGHYYERTLEGVFEISRVGKAWVRTSAVARRLPPPKGATPNVVVNEDLRVPAGSAELAQSKHDTQRRTSIVAAHYDQDSDSIVAELSTGAKIIVPRARIPRFEQYEPAAFLNVELDGDGGLWFRPADVGTTLAGLLLAATGSR